MLSGIFIFQYDNGLRVDGVMYPGGPTERAINRKLACLSFADGNHYDPNQPRRSDGRWGSAGGGGKSVDNEKLVDTVRQNALTVAQYQRLPKNKQGKCATKVREALEAAGADTRGHPVPAKDYGPTLDKNGFKPVEKGGYVPKKGDIVVIQPVPGATKQYGHIAVFDGKQWVSDFKQNDIWGGDKYRKAKPPYTVYRHGG